MFFTDRPLIWSIHQRLLWVDNDLHIDHLIPLCFHHEMLTCHEFLRIVSTLYSFCARNVQKNTWTDVQTSLCVLSFSEWNQPRSAMCNRPQGPEQLCYSYAGDAALKCAVSLLCLKIKDMWYNGLCDNRAVFELNWIVPYLFSTIENISYLEDNTSVKSRPFRWTTMGF